MKTGAARPRTGGAYKGRTSSRSRPCQQVGGVADLPFAGQEDEDVAGALGGQLADRFADRLALVASSSTGRYRTSTG